MEEEGKLGVDQTRTGDLDLTTNNDLANVNDTVPLPDTSIQDESGDQLTEEESATPEELVQEAHRVLTGGAASAPSNSRKVRRSKKRAGKAARKDSDRARKRENSTGQDVADVNPFLAYFVKLGFQNEDVCAQAVQQLDAEGTFSELLKEAGYENLWVTPQVTEAVINALSFRTDTNQILRDIEALTSTGLLQFDFSVNRHEARLSWELLLTLPRDIREAAITGQAPEVLPPTGSNKAVVVRPTPPDSAMYDGLKPPRSLKKSDPEAYAQDLAYYEQQRSKFRGLKKSYDEQLDAYEKQQKLFERELSKDPARADEWEQYQITKKLTSRISKKVSPNLSVEYRDSSRYDTYDQKTRTQSQLTTEVQNDAAEGAKSSAANEEDRQKIITRLLDENLWATAPEGQLRGLLEMAVQAEETAPLKPLIKKYWTTRSSLLTELGFDEQGNYVLFIEDKTYTTGMQRFMAGVKGVLQVFGALGFLTGVSSESSFDLQAVAPLLDSKGGLRLDESARDRDLKGSLYSLFGGAKVVDSILQLTGWGPGELLATLHSGVEAGKKIETAMKIGDSSVEHIQLIQQVLQGNGLEDKSRSEDANDTNKIILQRDDITGSTSLSVPMLPIASQSAIFGDKTVKMKTSLVRGLRAELKGDRSASQGRHIAVSLAEISLNDLMITTPDGMFNIGNISLSEFKFEAHAPDGRPRSVLEKFLTSVGQIVRDLSLRIMKFLPISSLIKMGAGAVNAGFNAASMFKDYKAFDKGFEAVNFGFEAFNLSDLSTSDGDYVGNVSVGQSALDLSTDSIIMGNYSDPIALQKELDRLQRDAGRNARKLQRSNPSSRGHNDLVRKQDWYQSEIRRVMHLQSVHEKVYPLERKMILLQRQAAQISELAGEQPSESQKQQLASIQAEISALQVQVAAVKFDGVSARGQIGEINVSNVDFAGTKVESITAAETVLEAKTNGEGETEAGFTATNEKITLTGLEMRDPNRIDESLQAQKSELATTGEAALRDNLSKRNSLFERLTTQASSIAESSGNPSLATQVSTLASSFAIANTKQTAEDIFTSFKNGDGETLLASFDETCALDMDAVLAVLEGLSERDAQTLQATVEALYTFQRQMRTQIQQVAKKGDDLQDQRQDLEPLLQEYDLLRERLTSTSNPLTREEQARYMQLHARLHQQAPSTKVDRATIEGASFDVSTNNMTDLMGSETDASGNTTNTTDVTGVDASLKADRITVEGLDMAGTSIDKVTSTDASVSFDGSKQDGALSISSGNTTIEGTRTEGLGDQYNRERNDNSTEIAEVQAEIERINSNPQKTSSDSQRLDLLKQRLETLQGDQTDLDNQSGGQQGLQDFLAESGPIVDTLAAWPHSSGKAIDFSRGLNAKAAHEAANELDALMKAKQAQLQTVSADVQTYSKGTEAVRAEYAQYVAQKAQAEADIKDRPYDGAMVAQRQELITALDDKITELKSYLTSGEAILQGNESTQLQLLNSLELDRINVQKARNLASSYDFLVDLARDKGVDPSKLALPTSLEEMSARGIQRVAQGQIDMWNGMSVDKISFSGSVAVDNLSQLDALKDMFGPQTADPTKESAEGTNVGLDVQSLSVEGVRQGDEEILSKLDLGGLKGQVILKDANTISIPDLSLGDLSMTGLDWGDPSMGLRTPKMDLKGMRVSADIAFDPITGAMGNATLNSLTVAEAKATGGPTTFRYEDYLIDMDQLTIQGTEKDPGVSLSGMDLSNFEFSSLDLNNTDIQGLGIDMGAGLTVSGQSIHADNVNMKGLFTPSARVRIDKENRDAMSDGGELVGDMANKYSFDLKGVDASEIGVKMETMGLDMKLGSVQGDAKGMDYDLETEIFNFRDLDLSSVKMSGITYDAPDMLFSAPGGMDLQGIKVSGRYEMKTGKTVLDNVYAEEAAIGYLQYKTPGPDGMDVSLQEAHASKFHMTNFVMDEGGMDLNMNLGQSDVSGLNFAMGDALNGTTLKGGFELNSLGFEMLRDGAMTVDFNGVSSKAGEDITIGNAAQGRDVDGNNVESGASVGGARLNDASGHVEMKNGQTIFQDISVGELGMDELSWHSIEGAGNMMNVGAVGASLKDIKVSGRLVEKEPREVAGMKLPVSDIFIDNFSVETIDASNIFYTDNNGVRVDMSRAKEGQAILRGLNVTDLKMIDGALEDGNLGIEHVGTAIDFKQSGQVGGQFQEVLSASSTVQAGGIWATFDKGTINGGLDSLDVDNTSLDWDMDNGSLNISPLHARILGLDGGMDTTEFGDDSEFSDEFARNNAMHANVDEMEVVDDAPITYTSKPGSREPDVALKNMSPEMYNDLKSSWFKDTDNVDEARQDQYWNSLSDEERAKMQEEAAFRRQDQENTSEFVQAIDKNVLNTISGSIKVDMTMQAQALLETVESVIKVASGAARGRPGGVLSGIWNQLKLSYNVIKEKFTGKKEWRSYQVIEIVDGQVKGDLGSIVGLAVGLSQGISRGADAVGELGEAFGATGKALWESTPIDLVMMLWSDQQRTEFNDAWGNANKEWADVMDAFGDIADIFTKLRNGELNNLTALENEFGILDMATDPSDEEEILDEMLQEILKVPDPDSSALSWLDNNLIGMTIDSVDMNLSTKPFKIDNLPNNTSITVPAANITAKTTGISKGRLSIRGNINLSGLEYSSGDVTDRTEASVGSADVKLPSVGLSTWTQPEGRYDQYKATIGAGSRFRNLSFYRNKFVKNL